MPGGAVSHSAPIARDSKHGKLRRSLVLSAPIFPAPLPAPPAHAGGEVRLTIKVVDEAPDFHRIVAIAYTARISDDRQELLADRSVDLTVTGGEVPGGFVEAAE